MNNVVLPTRPLPYHGKGGSPSGFPEGVTIGQIGQSLCGHPGVWYFYLSSLFLIQTPPLIVLPFSAPKLTTHMPSKLGGSGNRPCKHARAMRCACGWAHVNVHKHTHMHAYLSARGVGVGQAYYFLIRKISKKLEFKKLMVFKALFFLQDFKVFFLKAFFQNF